MIKNISNEIIDQVKNILTPLQNNINYFEISGSAALDFINNPHDYDIIVICEDKEKSLSCRNYIRENYILNEDNKASIAGFNFKFTTAVDEETKLINSNYPYLLKDRKYYAFDESVISKSIDISELLNRKDDFKNACIKRIDYLENKYKERENPDIWNYCNRKSWYQTYITICILKNNSWELTEEQKANANLLHDIEENTFEQRKELVKQLINEIKKL